MSKGVDRRFVLCKKKQFFLNGEVYSLTKSLLMDDPVVRCYAAAEHFIILV
jgi:hypothetical protein